MTNSPYLDQPKRDPDTAMFDAEDRRHRRALGEIVHYFEFEQCTNPDNELTGRYIRALAYAIDQLDKHAAARILERNRDNG